MSERSWKNRNIGERSNHRLDINSPVNNNEQFDNDSFNQIDDDENESNEPETPDFSDDDYGELFDDEALCPDIVAEHPREHESLGNIIIIDNLPKVDPSRIEKLKGVIARIYNEFGGYQKEHIPVDGEGKTKGYGFFEFKDEETAARAVRQTDGYRLDKNHTFSVTLMSDYDRSIQIPAEPSEFNTLFSWLTEADAADQFAVQSEDPKKTTIYLNTLSGPIVIEDRLKWTENKFVWSPKGTYFASFHEPGIALWGCKEFRQIQRFAHRGVTHIEFSPTERYLITTSARPNNYEAFIIWDVITGQKKRSFPFDQSAIQGSAHFKWSFQDKYFGKQGIDGINMYDTETFQLVDKKPFKIPSLTDFQWSPTDNSLAYWTAEDGNVPARLVLTEINGIKLEDIRSKTLFNVIDCKLAWQKRGDYLVVKVDRYTKKSGEKNNPRYSGLIYNFEIFHMREKNVPLDTLEIKETVQSFAIEPVGHKLIVITGEGLKTNVNFYRLGQGQKSGKIEILKTMPFQVTTAFWSPFGQYVVLAAIKTASSPGGSLIFIDSNDMSIMSKQEHIDISDVEWDPTGRYVITSVNLWNAKRDHSFKLWSFQGNLVFEKIVERLFALHWRPRPPSLLTEEINKTIRRNRPTWTPRMELRDKLAKSGRDDEQQRRRRQQLDDFQKLKDENINRLAIQKAQRMQLRRGIDTDSLFEQQSSNIGEEVVEILIHTEEVEYKP